MQADMKIHGDFTGGNIEIREIVGDEILIKNQIRDTTEDWFYWAFCVEGAQGRELAFRFDKKWIGYHGPAVSHDLENWHWLGSENPSSASDSFVYRFGPEEACVYFAHNMLYHPSRFEAFCRERGLKAESLCRSEKGRDVPYISFGIGKETVLLTVRHHACEATGNYVLEGVIEELLGREIPGLRVIAVPFVDYDGVVCGDQGKSRNPWDHNRDYDPAREALYRTVGAIRKIAADEKIRYAFDFHSPWHLGGENDRVFIPLKHIESGKEDARFSELFEKSISPGSLPYHAADNFPPNCKWNASGTPCFGNYMYHAAGAELAFTLETPYFTASGRVFGPKEARETGRCFARALRCYHESKAAG